MKLQAQDPPMLTIGKSDTVVQVLPAGLRFWEKLGLGPRSGQKNVTAFMFFEGGGDEREVQMEQWLEQVSATYTVRFSRVQLTLPAHKNYRPKITGRIYPEIVIVVSDLALYPCTLTLSGRRLVRLMNIQSEKCSYVETLSPVNFVSTLPLPHPNLVFYIITPPSILSLSSPVLRQLFSAVKRALRTHADAHLLIQFVPEELITGAFTDPRTSHSGLEPFVDSVYDRVLQPVERAMSRKLFTISARTVESFHAPAFMLARMLPGHPGYGQSLISPVSFVLDPRPRSLDVMERYALLHVGYQISPCGRWLFASCVDCRGEAHDLGAWLVKSDASEGVFTSIVSRVWSFASNFARRAHVEWRIAVAKLGRMGPEELDGRYLFFTIESHILMDCYCSMDHSLGLP